MRFVAVLVFLSWAVSWARADRADDIARIHIEAIGGRERLEKLGSLRASGTAIAAGKQVRFTMLAARPNKVRVETESGGRTLVQGYDGEESPWEFDTGTWPPQYRSMPDSNAKLFATDAEFDDPLVGGKEQGYAFDFAGEVEAEGRKLLRILVTRRLTETYSIYLDEQTFFVVMKVEQRMTAGGRRAPVVTHYEDFRPVDGVLMPHQITVAIEGRMTQQTRITRIDGNPKLTKDAFTRPKVAAPVRKGGD